MAKSWLAVYPTIVLSPKMTLEAICWLRARVRKGAAHYERSLVTVSTPEFGLFCRTPHSVAGCWKLHWFPTGIGKNHICGLLAHHINGTNYEESRYSRKYRGINHAQALGSIDLESRIQNAALISGSDCTTAGSVMTPGVRADKLAQLVRRVYLFSRQLFPRDQPLFY